MDFFKFSIFFTLKLFRTAIDLDFENGFGQNNHESLIFIFDEINLKIFKIFKVIIIVFIIVNHKYYFLYPITFIIFLKILNSEKNCLSNYFLKHI